MPLDDYELTGTGQSSAQLFGISSLTLTRALTDHLLGQVLDRGARGGPLASLARQLNDDASHLQARQIELKN